ncbi:type VII secretion target [Actinoplanes sp. NPDC049596]|uniref:type VII secretion target n=1 Tax=unclassified Actinoplanes TaxID=2626549 RepID=UPI003424D422
MSGEFSVRPADLAAHGGHVEDVAGQVDEAAAAGRAVQADAGAYGRLCAMVPAMLNVLQSVLVDGIGDSAGSLRDTGAKLRATAEHYDSTDQASADAITRSGPAR